jgi:succinoglycan biosynthesis protein ExoV
VRLIYYQGTVQNFGDEINRVIWPKLAPELFEEERDEGFLGIGTIIGMPTPGCSHLHVFSSGMGYDSLARWQTPRTVWCVRGPLTSRLFGTPPEATMTDGAILAPAAMPDWPNRCAARGIGVIPHWESMRFSGWQESCTLAGMKLISPIGSPAEVVDRLLSVELVLAESLHGAILADTYGIPWVAFVSSGNFSVFKWKDWTMSVDVPLKVMVLPPPSAMPLLHFGRPFSKRWGEYVHYDEDAAQREFSMRCEAAHRAAGSMPGVRTWIKQSSLTSAALDRLMSFNPARTAEVLSQTAQQEPNLSRAGLRESIRQRMLDRLMQLCRSAGVQLQS